MQAHLVTIEESGQDGEVIWLNPPELVVGRSEEACGQSYPHDTYLSPQHARFYWEGDDALFLEDLGSINGTHVRVRSPRPLHDGDVFLMGRQVVRFATPRDEGRAGDVQIMGSPAPDAAPVLMHMGVGELVHAVHRLVDARTILGREPAPAEGEGAFAFPSDRYMGPQHAEVVRGEDGGWTLDDLGSTNGTWLRVRHQRLESGDLVFLGTQLFRVEGLSS